MALKAEVLAELKAAVQESGAKVEDLFTSEEITASEPAKKAKQTEYEHAKRIEKSLGEEREKVITLTKSIDEKEGKIKELNGQVSQTQASSLFTKSVADRKLNDKQKSFIERRLTGFKSEKSGDELKLEFEKYIDGEIKEFGEIAKTLGVKVDEQAPNDSNKGAGNDDGKSGEGADLSDPATNDFIPAV